VVPCIFHSSKDTDDLRLDAHPELHFLVVINPSNGPGNNPLPDDNYSAQILKLNNYTNVETVGYVRTGYATQNITNVAEEVATYAGWDTQNNSLAMHGIFFDEAPHEYSADAVSYMQIVNQVVKNSTLQGAKTVSLHHFSISFFIPGPCPVSQGLSNTGCVGPKAHAAHQPIGDPQPRRDP
jgi:hypothetical protein